MYKLRSKLKQFKLTGEPFTVLYDGKEWRVRRNDIVAVCRIIEWNMVFDMYNQGYAGHDNDAESIVTALQVIKLESIGRRMARWK